MVMGKNAMVPGGPGHLKSQVCLELVGLTPFPSVPELIRTEHFAFVVEPDGAIK
jgi:hypothetical protein